MSSSLRAPEEAPEVHVLLTKFGMLEHSMNEVIRRTKDAGGSLEPFDAACEWLKAHNDTVVDWIPKCVTNPGDPLKTGDTVFDGFTLKCKTVTALPEFPVDQTCVGPISADAPGKKDRSFKVIKMSIRPWMSQPI